MALAGVELATKVCKAEALATRTVPDNTNPECNPEPYYNDENGR